MKISEISALLHAQVLSSNDSTERLVTYACASDMMSDVLASKKNPTILITHLINSQVVRTAEMMDIICVIFVSNKMPTMDMIQLANDSNIVLMSTEKDMFEASGKIYSHGLIGGQKYE